MRHAQVGGHETSVRVIGIVGFACYWGANGGYIFV